MHTLVLDGQEIGMPATFKSQKDCDSLQEDLDVPARWESDWLMAFHPDKCSVLTITNKKNPVKHNSISILLQCSAV
jgi:hypothetical protein